jgi:hypothetical protein
MSKIEVNTIEPQCGTTLTLGGCGQTVALGSGASQTGFGRTGTVDWITTPKVTGDSPITAVTGKGYFLNTTAGTITINLPAGAAGSIVSMADYAATWQTNNVTVAPNGTDKIGSVNVSVVLNTEGQSVTFVYVDSTQGWINTMDSTSNVRGNNMITASGGTPAAGETSGDFKYHTFTGPGTFCVSIAAVCAANNEVSYMVVAGGGAGGGSQASSSGGSGGGGAGGFREKKSAIDTYTASPLDGATPITVTASPYTIATGGGGNGVPSGVGGSGSVSTFSSITSAGGGGGGTRAGAPPTVGNGVDGGSGGGGGYGTSASGTAGSGNTPFVSPPQGQDGAAYVIPVGSAPGGGGGAGAVGGTSPGPNVGGVGGAGVTTAISGASVVRSGGGGGGATTSGAGGSGGGAAGDPGPSPNAGTCNTGGGGGGQSACGIPTATTGGGGGSGIVIIRYKFQ